MEIVEEGAPTTAKEHQKLAMEDYLDFVDNRTLQLAGYQLRRIIGMHGFKQIGARKRMMIDMISTMDLMDLHRSTLLDGGVSGDACFTLQEVINDLKDLQWQECHVTSLLTQVAVVSASSAASSGATVSVKRKRAKRKAFGKKANEVEADHSVVSTGTTVAAGSTTEKKEAPMEKKSKKEPSAPKASSSRKKTKDGEDDGSKMKKQKKKKDPNAPKRAISAFLFFGQKEREDVKKSNPGISFAEIAKVLGERWNKMTAGEKAPYEEKARADKKRYTDEIRGYKNPLTTESLRSAN